MSLLPYYHNLLDLARDFGYIDEAAYKARRVVPKRDPLNPDGRQLRRFERDLKDKTAVALSRLSGYLFTSLTDINQLEARINSRDAYDMLERVLLPIIQDVATSGADFGRQQVEREALGVKALEDLIGVDWGLVNNDAADWALGYVGELVRGILSTTRDRIRKEVARFITSGESLADLRRRLMKDYLFSESRAEAIAVTEVTRAYAEGNQTAWRQSGVTQGKRWNTANDELVCPICGPVHNAIVPIDQPFTTPAGQIDVPPAHPRCRCWITPIVEGAEERPVGLQR